MSRDYIAEMRAVIDAEANGTYVPSVVAAHIVEKLRQTDADLLAGWLDAQAEQILRHAINLRDGSQRTAARYSRPRSVFAADAAAAEAEAGSPAHRTTQDQADARRAHLAGWLSTRFTVEDGSRKPLAAMGHDELLFVADAYESRARENRLTAAFAKAIARKVQTGVVGDYFTDSQLSTMWDSLRG